MRCLPQNFFAESNQGWFDLNAIVSIDDYGWSLGCQLTTGRTYTISGERRREFFEAVGIIDPHSQRDAA